MVDQANQKINIAMQSSVLSAITIDILSLRTPQSQSQSGFIQVSSFDETGIWTIDQSTSDLSILPN
ncbi:MAG: hypothetical protein IPK55_12060 [Streptococcus sp.]|nr:hypothetical protein [Streptococcus sp.]